MKFNFVVSFFIFKIYLYLYLIDLCSDIIMNEIDEKFDKTVTDFFGRIMLSANIKVSVMKKHPAIFLFLANVYFETDGEVKDDIKAILAKGDNFRNKIAFDGTDTSKFKDNIDTKLVMKMLVWLAEGYTSQISNKIDTVKNSKISGSVSVGILFGSFVISKITDLTDKVNLINAFSPFKYFSYQKIVYSNTISIGISTLSLVFIAILVVLTYFFYMKRNLNL